MKKLLPLTLMLCVILSLSSCVSLTISSDPAQTTGTPDTKPAQTTGAPSTEPASTDEADDEAQIPSEFVGYWVYKEPSGFLEIAEDGVWALLDDDAKLVKSGSCRYDEDNEYLVLEESETLDFDFLRFNEDGDLLNGTSDVLSPTEKPTVGSEGLDKFIGTWKYDDRDVYITIRDNSTWELEGDDDAENTAGGCRMEEGDMLVLETYGGEDVNYLKFDDDGVLCDSVYDTLSRYEPAARDDSLLSPFVGEWEYDDRDGVLVITADWQWELYDGEDDLENHGICRYEEGYGLVLEDGEGIGDYDFLRVNDDGDVFNSVGVLLTRLK